MAVVSDVAEVRLGRQRSPKNHAGSNMRPYLRAANVTWNGLDLSDVKEMHFSEDEVATYRLVPGDVLVAEASGSRGEVGKPAVWRGEIDDCCFQNTLLRVRTRGPLPEYLRYYLLSEAISGRLGEAARGVGIHHLGAAGLSTYPITVAPLAEQERVVAAIEEQFSRIDAAQFSLANGQRKIESLRHAVLAAVVPETEKWLRTDDVADVRGGIQKQPKRRPSKNRYPFLRVANVGRNHVDLSEVHEVELFDGELERYKLEPGDLLVVEGNGSPDEIGRSALWRGEIDNCVHQNHLIRVRPSPDIDPEFLALYWNAPQTAARLRDVASSTSGLYTLSTAKVKSIPVPVVTLDEQRLIVQRTEEQLSLLAALSEAIEVAFARSARLRRSILARAFAGHLSAQDPEDEPASELLTRIVAQRSEEPMPRRRKRA